MSDYIYTLYKTTCLLNDKIYIGIHRTKNPHDNYLGSGREIKRAIRKYGKINFKKEILEILPTEQAMYDREKEIVTSEFVLREDNYNVALGGWGRPKMVKKSDAFKKKVGLAHKGRKHRREVCPKCGKKVSLVGRYHFNNPCKPGRINISATEAARKVNRGKPSPNTSHWKLTEVDTGKVHEFFSKDKFCRDNPEFKFIASARSSMVGKPFTRRDTKKTYLLEKLS